MASLETILAKRPELKLLSKAKLFATLKDQGITKKQIDDHLNPKELTQIYAKPQRTVEFKITSPPRSFQLDIALLPKYKKANKGVAQFLIAVDILSRKAFAYPLANGTMPEVITKFKAFMRDVGGHINKVEGDDFFNNSAFRKLSEEHGIAVVTHVAKSDHITPVGNRLGIVDRCIRTIKGLLTKHMLSHDTAVWTDKLADIVTLYNDTPHSGVDNQAPSDVFADDDFSQAMYEGQLKKNNALDRAVDIMIGDDVRVMDEKKVFDKEKAPWSRQIYQVVDKLGYSYQLRDEAGRTVTRLYRPGELYVIKGGAQGVKDRVTSGGKVAKAEQHSKHVKRVARALGPARAEETIGGGTKKTSKRLVKRPARYE
jgi:hypothetical protein